MNTVLKALIAAACLATTLAMAQTPEAQTPEAQTPEAQTSEAQNSAAQAVAADAVDLASAEMGGRVEWVTSQNFSASGGGAAMNLIATTPRHYGQEHEYGWTANGPAPQDIVFSFFSKQTALVASVLVNPLTAGNNDRPQDIEIWVSSEDPVEGFAKVAAATLTREDSLQAVTFTPVEARYVKLRILTTTGPTETDNPGSFAPGAKRVKILEGTAPGYQTLLQRNPALAALLGGDMPAAPSAASLPPPVAGEAAACQVPAEEPTHASTYPQSSQVLVLAPYPDAYRTVAWKSSVIDDSDQQTRPVVPGVSYAWMPPSGAAPAHLVSEPLVDTVILAQVCVPADLSDGFKQALFAWVATGHKLIIQDSDFCSGGYTPNYDFMPYPFATVNPGAFGANGEAGVLENSTLASNNPNDRSFIDTDAWKAGPNDLGDSNVIVQYDARWCGAMWAKNRLQKNGMALGYARYGRGLIIYSGFDSDQVSSSAYQQLDANELLQPFDPDYLPCTQPMGDFIITAPPAQKSQSVAAGRTYSYPVSVLGNFGYSGTVTLEASVAPADSGLSVALDTTTADLTSVDEAQVTLTVTAGPAASAESGVVTVRGRDAAGKSNVLCLDLPKRRSGSVLVASGLQTDKTLTRNIEIILDASGSMKAALGSSTRWATAIDVLQQVVEKLPADFSVGLRAYGHTLSSKDPNTCTDSALVVPVGPLEPASLMAAARQLAPRGETPLVYSILQTPADLLAAGGGTVILITDGEESCKGDFATARDTLQASGIALNLNIVGFTLDNAPAEALLSGLAESTGGHYYGAASGEALSRAILLAAVDRLPYRILDAAGAEVAQGEAGTTSAHELAPGDYTVVISAAGEELRTPITVELGRDIMLKALIRDGQLVVETGASEPTVTTDMPTSGAEAGVDAAAPPPTTSGPTAEPVATAQSEPTATASPSATPQAAPEAVNAPAVAPPAAATGVDTAQGGGVEPVWQRLQAALAEIARDHFDPAAVIAEAGTSPEALFIWVRDQTTLLPYCGELKGAGGVLLDRGGNALDRALLLRALLVQAGHVARLAHAQLTEEQAAPLLAALQHSVPAAQAAITDTQALADRAATALGLDAAGVLAEMNRAAQAETELQAALAARTERHSAALLKALGPVGHPGAAAAFLTDHWWVLLERPGAEPLNLDPSLGSAAPGDHLAESTLASDLVTPEQLANIGGDCGKRLHSVRIRAVAEVFDGNTLVENVLLDHELLPAELAGQKLALSIAAFGGPGTPDPFSQPAPATALIAALLQDNEWQPVLTVGSESVKGKTVTAAGEVHDAPAGGDGTGGIFGGFGDALGGGGGGRFTAFWWTFEVHTPGVGDSTERRQVFDLIGPGARAAGSTGEAEPGEEALITRALALAGQTELTALPAAPDADLLNLVAGSRLLAERDEWQKLYDLGRALPMAELNGRLNALGGLRTPLERFALERGRFAAASGAGPQVGLTVLAYHRRLRPDLSVDQAYDLIAAPPGSVTAHQDGFTARLRAGVADTNLEALLGAGGVSGPEGLTVAEAFDRDPGSWRIVRDPGDLAGSVLPPDLAARIAADLADKFVAVVPTDARDTVGWWRIDPATGETLGRGSRGWGQAMTEYSENTAVVLQLRTVINQYASMGRCLGMALSQPLQGIQGVGEELADCMFNTICGQIASGLANFVTSDMNWTNVIILNTIQDLWGGTPEVGFNGFCGALWSRMQSP